MRISGTTKLTGLIGNPVEHTVSPVLHNSLFMAMNINGIYVPVKAADGSLKVVVNGLKAAGFAGFNITIPYKEAILEYTDEFSEEVKLLGVANTVKIADGKLYAYNTDADGFARAFEEQTGSDFQRKSVCILGAGGTAKALAVKIALKAAERVSIINRTEVKAAELASYVNHVIADKDCTGKESTGKVAFAEVLGSIEALRALNECDIIVNTTSVGMYPDIDSSPIEQGFLFHSKQIIYDVIYNPTQTKLLAAAKANGCKTVNGAGMLFYQGLKAFEIFLDTVVPDWISSCLMAEFLKYLGT